MTVYYVGTEPQDFASESTRAQSTNDAHRRTENTRLAMEIRRSSSEYIKTKNFNQSEFWFSFVYNQFDQAATSGLRFLDFITDGVALLKIKRIDDNMVVEKDDGTILASGDSTGVGLVNNDLCKFDFFIKIGASGELKGFVDGTPIFSVSDVDLTWTGVSHIENAEIHMPLGIASRTAHVSELLVTSWPAFGSSKVVLRRVSAIGNYDQWEGDAVGNVNGIAPNNQGFASFVANERQSFTKEEFPALGASEALVAMKATGFFRSDTEDPDAINYFLRIGGTDYDAADQVTGEAASVSELWSQNPATSGAWDVTALNGAEIGIRSRTT